MRKDMQPESQEKMVKLIVGALGKNKRNFLKAKHKLEERFGRCDYESEFMPFKSTDYYYKEFGKPLWRKFYSFKKPVSSDKIIKIKLFTNDIENSLRKKNNSRRINLDPGYLDESKLVLATHKNHQHRIYIGKGVYAEVTLRYTGGTFKPWEWTYPDYQTRQYIDIFNKIRNDWLRISRRLS